MARGRAYRRHHADRMLAHALTLRVVDNDPERARRWRDNACKCSCHMCGHSREQYGMTHQERKQLEARHD